MLIRCCSLLSLCFVTSLAVAEPKLTQVWQLDGLAVPESVLYYPIKKKDHMFVSQIDGEPTGLDGKGGIALIDTSGKLLEKDWVTGLNAPKGMAAKDDLLYVSDIDHLVIIDIPKAKVISRIPAAGSVFLNDVAVNAAGDVFVSDTRINKIYQLKNGKLDVFLENVVNANGLAFVKSNMLVGAGKELQQVDKNKKISVIASGFAENIDGIEQVGKKTFVVSCWPGLVYLVDAKGKLTQLIDSRADKINTADIGFVPDKKLVLVPNFFKNTVTAYQLSL